MSLQRTNPEGNGPQVNRNKIQFDIYSERKTCMNVVVSIWICILWDLANEIDIYYQKDPV